MAIKEYSTFSKASVLESHYQMQFSVIIWTLVGDHIYQPLRSGRIWHKVNF